MQWSQQTKAVNMIHFGSENTECGQNAPWLISCEEIKCNEYPDNGLKIIIGVSSGEKYEIIFSNYTMHMTRNESFTVWDNYETRKGRYLVIFEKSRLLDFYDTAICHTDDNSWPPMGKHYGVYTENHIIDVITASEPIIRKII